MSEDQAVSAPAVDVAAIRAALDRATPGPWETGPDWAAIASGADSVIHGYVDTLCDSCGERVHGAAEVAVSVADVELIVLLRNNAEALLDALEAEHTTLMVTRMLRSQAERALAEAEAKVARVEALVLPAKPQTVGSTFVRQPSPHRPR